VNAVSAYLNPLPVTSVPRAPSAGAVEYIGKNTPRHNPMRRVLSERMAILLHSGWNPDDSEKWKQVMKSRPDVCLDIMKQLLSFGDNDGEEGMREGPGRPCYSRLSDFHPHGPGEDDSEVFLGF